MILSTLFGSRADNSWFPAGADAIGGGPSSNFWYRLASLATKSKVPVDEVTALTYSAVWCATMRRVGTMAQLPKNLYRRTGESQREIARDRREHWLLHEQPNPEMTATAYNSLMEEWRLNGGNAYAEIQWDRNLRTGGESAFAVWPIHPCRVKMIRSQEDLSLWYEVRNNGAEPSYIPAASMIHLPSIITRDGHSGLGVIENAREGVGFGIATEQHGADLLGGGGVPVIAREQEVAVVKDQSQRDNFRREWKEIHGQGNNVPAILPPGMKIKTLTLSMEDLQFLTLRQHNIEEMARWYDLPPHTLHHLLRATFSNIEHSAIEMVQYSFLPWIVPNEQEYLRKLFPNEAERRGYYFKWEVNGLLRGDSAARSAIYHSGIVDGWLSPNEVRGLEDWNPYEGGDTYLIQGAMVPVETLSNTDDDMTRLPATDDATSETSVIEATAGDAAATDVQSTALNGAQIVALVGIANQLAQEQLPKEGSRALIEAAFPSMSRDLIDRMVEELDKFTPKESEPAAKTPAAATSASEVVAVLTRQAMELEATHATLKATARGLFAAALSRMIHKEATAARRASGKPAEFLAWLDEFYAGHEATLAESLGPVFAACSSFGLKNEPQRWAAVLCEQSRSRLLDVAGEATKESLAGCVGSLMDEWEHDRAECIVRGIAELN